MVTKVTVRGQTVVPAAIRSAHHIHPECRLEWIDDGKCIRVVPLPDDPVKAARGLFRGSKMTKALLEARSRDKNRG